MASGCLGYKAKQGGTLEQCNNKADHNQPDDDPVQPCNVRLILLVPQLVEHILEHLKRGKPTSRMSNPAEDGCALEQANDDFHHNQPDDNPLQASGVEIVLMISEHV